MMVIRYVVLGRLGNHFSSHHRTRCVFIPLMRFCVFHYVPSMESRYMRVCMYVCILYGVYSHVCMHDNGLYHDRPFMYIVFWAWVGDEVERKISILNLRLRGLRILFLLSFATTSIRGWWNYVFFYACFRLLHHPLYLLLLLLLHPLFTVSPFYRFNFSLFGCWI